LCHLKVLLFHMDFHIDIGQEIVETVYYFSIM